MPTQHKIFGAMDGSNYTWSGKVVIQSLEKDGYTGLLMADGRQSHLDFILYWCGSRRSGIRRYGLYDDRGDVRMIGWIAMLYSTAVAVMTSGVAVFLGFLVYLALRGE